MSIQRPHKSLLKKILEYIFQIECLISKKWVEGAHSRLFYVQWGIGSCPEWFDHHQDLYWHWTKTGNSLWLERGVFSSLALQNGKTLELSCGDGFNAKNFYAHRSSRVVACDFDVTAIRNAKLKNRSDNVEYRLLDIRGDLPEGRYENIIWDAAIEHFRPTEIDLILKKISEKLVENGVFSGYTIVEKADGQKSLDHHEYEFKSKEELQALLKAYFRNVIVFETIYPSRHNLYFWAGNGVIPFFEKWPNFVN